MKPIDDQLNRLFRGARPAEAASAPMPYGLETKVLAAWRARGQGEAGLWDMGLLTRGLTVAILIMGLSLWPVLRQSSATSMDPFSDYLQGADASLRVDDAS